MRQLSGGSLGRWWRSWVCRRGLLGDSGNCAALVDCAALPASASLCCAVPRGWYVAFCLLTCPLPSLPVCLHPTSPPAEMRFHYRDKQSPDSYASSLAQSMQVGTRQWGPGTWQLPLLAANAAEAGHLGNTKAIICQRRVDLYLLPLLLLPPAAPLLPPAAPVVTVGV